MNVYVVEYCDAVVGVFSTKKKATDYVSKEVKRYASDFNDLKTFKEWIRDYKNDYEIYKIEVDNEYV